MTMSDLENRSKVKHSAPFLRVFAARCVLFWEKAWPASLPILAPICVLTILSLFGVWAVVPPAVHWALLGLGLVITVFMAVKLKGEFIWPSRRAGLVRLEKDSAFEHAPLQSLEDRPFDPAAIQKQAQESSGQTLWTESAAQKIEGFQDGNTALNRESQQLWQAHQEQMKRAVKKTRINSPLSTADARDPYALRFVVLGLLIISSIAAGSERWYRLSGMFMPGSASQSVASRIDMWIEPPSYTGLAPMQLVRGGDAFPDLADQVSVPQGSKLIAQVNGRRGVKLSYVDGDEKRYTIKAKQDDDEDADPSSAQSEARAQAQSKVRAKDRNAERLEFEIVENGLIALKLGPRSGSWPVLVIEDTAPIVEILSEPVLDNNENMVFHYSFEDDYGAASAVLQFRLNPDQGRPLDAPDIGDYALNSVRSVVLDGSQGQSGERKIGVSLKSDPWAGLDVIAKIIVLDGAAQPGESSEKDFTIPTKEFFNPLAKSVIEQRQNLAVAPEKVQKVRDAFQAVTVLPEIFSESTAEYLLLRDAFWRVQRQRDDQYEDTIEYFWPLALELEDTALELARRRLDAAIEALRASLEANAPQSEIDENTLELQSAIQQYLQALAAAGITEEGGGGGDQIGQDTIQEMLDGIGDLSEGGANNAARQLLGDLESLLQNLKLTESSGGEGGLPGAPDSEPETPSEEVGDLIGRQRELSDNNFALGQDGSGGNSPSSENSDDLAREQQDIANSLEELLDELRESGQGNSAGNNPSEGEGQSGQESGQEENRGQNGQGQSGQGQPGENDQSGSGSDSASAQSAFENALREMFASRDALSGEDFDGAATAMDEAIANLREGAKRLAEEQAREADNQDGEGEGEGEGQGEGDSREASGRDPLGRPTGNGEGSVEVPGLSDPALTQNIIEKLRKRLSEQGRTRDEIEYLERLLEAF